MAGKSNLKQGWFVPTKPEKYVVSKNSITEGKGVRYMSSWEYRFFQFCDFNPAVKKWSSEPFPVQYFSELDGKVHNYYPDVLIEVENSKGEIVRWLVEIKPFAETQPPKPPKKKTQKAMNNFVKAQKTYYINQQKWSAARKFCEDNNLVWKVITEKEIF